MLWPVEVAALLAELDGVACLLYGSGLRLAEALDLRVKDHDRAYRAITARDAKGAKDRMMPVGLRRHAAL